MSLGAVFLQAAMGALAGRAVSKAIDKASAIAEEANQAQQNKEQETMSEYDIIGEDYDDDDDVGGIGADDDLLDALVSGDGSSEIIGADFIVGAKKRNAKAKRAAALRQLANRNAGAVVKRNLERRRRYPLGFTVTSIGAGAAATVAAMPQSLFRSERLVLPSDIAFDLGVTDIKVGNTSQFAQNAEVPGAIFSEVAIDTSVGFDTAEVGNQISVAVRYKTLAAVEFTGALIGTIAK